VAVLDVPSIGVKRVLSDMRASNVSAGPCSGLLIRKAGGGTTVALAAQQQRLCVSMVALSCATVQRCALARLSCLLASP
jgi:hypothetical protein